VCNGFFSISRIKNAKIGASLSSNGIGASWMVPIEVALKSHINALLVNKSKYFIKGSIASSLSLQFKSCLHHCFRTTIIGLIGSSSSLCENKPPIDH
jgi:hypothetical protein